MNESPVAVSFNPQAATPPAEPSGSGWYLAGIIIGLLAIFVLIVQVQSRRHNPPRPERRVRRDIL